MLESNQVQPVVSSVVTPVALEGYKIPLLNQFEGASAAYSLRRLKSWGDGENVVEVRRASDDTTRDFTAIEVSDGTMADWVNATVALPLDTASGAAAAYSLRSLSTAYSGNVVNVRRSSDDTTADFTAAEVADGTMADWVGTGGTDSGFVATWYDQSGNGNHAVQTTEFSQPKIVDGGVLVADGIQFDGVDDVLSSSTLSASQAITAFIATERNPICGYFGGTGSEVELHSGGISQYALYAGTPLLTADNSATPVNPVVMTLTANGVNSSIHENGILLASGDTGTNGMTSLTIGYVDRTGIKRYLNGTISELIIYDSDQSDNRIPIESNMADYYGDIDLPPGFDSGNNEVDGYVATWYDQSGNGNDAVQNVATSQPKIVENGVLLTDASGKPEIDFDGVDDGLKTTHVYTDTLQAATMLVVSQNDLTNGRHSMVRIRPNGSFGTTDGFIWEQGVNVTPTARYGTNTAIEGGGSSVGALVAGQGMQDTVQHLNTLVFQKSQILAYEDGALDETLTHSEAGSPPIGDVTLNDELWIGRNFDSNDREFDGTMQEVILYFDDQSAKRTDIEGNINDYYEIFADETYRRPDGSAIFRPDGTSVYERP